MQIVTQKNIKIAIKNANMPIYAGKYAICALCQNNAKNVAIEYLGKTDMPDEACQFYAAFKKICGPYKHQICCRNMRKSLELYIEWSKLSRRSCRRRWPVPTTPALITLLG